MGESKPPSVKPGAGKKIGDLSDAISGGMTGPELIRAFVESPPIEVDEMRARVAAAEAATRPPFDRATAVPSGVPRIPVNRLDRRELVVRAWEAVFAGNSPPFVFLRCGRIALVDPDPEQPRIELCETDHVNAVLLRAARWVKVTVSDDGEVDKPADVPAMVARDMVALPSRRLPSLADVIRGPTFAPDGRLISRPGFDPATGLYLAPRPGYVEPDVPTRPGSADVRHARALLFEQWLGDFPFVSAADRAHAGALLLLPFVRRLVAGPTPLHVVEAAERGTGKSLLARNLMVPSQGVQPAPVTLPRDAEETRKKITSLLVAGRQAVLFDNVAKEIDSAELAAVLTSTTWEDRFLGLTGLVSAPNTAAWIATANNAAFSTDIARRSVTIRLDRRMERPWEWRGARIADFDSWTLAHQEELRRAALVLVQSWLAAGRPAGTESLGSFEGWARVLGGILTHVGVPDFLANIQETHARGDRAGGEWRSFTRAWWEWAGAEAVHVAELAAFAEAEGLLDSVLGAASTARARAIKLGLRLPDHVGRIYSGLRIAEPQGSRKPAYRLECVDPTAMAWSTRPAPPTS